jgi:aerobic-type carbon monoxide dehydrogenase small subunit (CoxS/CutS family)
MKGKKIDPAATAAHSPDLSSGLTRRSFLKGAGVGTAGLSALHFSPRVTQAEDRPEIPPLLGPSPVPVRFEVNGQTYTVNVEPRLTLADVLRDHLDLTGTKVICDRGACGGCTVLLDNEPVVSCMLLAIAAQGKSIRTVEGLAQGTEQLDPLQEAFITHDAVQCGFCTPGMLMSCRALLDRTRQPTLDEIKAAVSGNLCRCGTYPHVFTAVLAASGQEPNLVKG